MEADVKKNDSPRTEDVMKKTEDMPKPAAASTYEPFTKAAYDEARAANRPILLYFYANWCPFCREQDPRFARVIPEHDGGVVALRVNYNDTDTDDDERALARTFGVTYQHTMFFIGPDGEVKKKVIGTISDAQTVEYLDLISR